MDFGLVDEESATELRSYQISFVVRSRCPSIGRTLHELGLPRMPEVQVLELWRAGQVVPEGLRTPLLHKDIVKVTATAASVARLRRAYDGLEPAVHRDLEILGARRRHRRLFEAVVAPKSQLAEAPLARQKERMLRLGAVILAVRRPGGTPKEAAGAGDVLLLEALPGCLEAAGDFTLVAPVEASKPPRAGKTQDRLRGLLCLLGFLAVILLNGGHLVPLATAVLVLDFLCCFSKVLGWKEAMRSVNGSVILTIAASFGISTALTQTGAASALANALLHVGLHYGPFGVLCMVYAGTALLTNIISNTATCVMMIPVASHVSHQLQATDCPCPFNEKTLLILVILASNSAFATPLGSPCNILVVDAGDYSFSDFLRFGGVLQLMMMVATCCLLYAYPCA
ncbi:unnamed protein product [Effrenium voratum]|uniref:RCK C-terminal domain-containing protein n=1 Tax=Effrenium voratum TaxID=2562239 RepID=A0AA36JBD8_9DINO|nr:unnamed protein product [Effrenium voratum]